MPVSSKAGQLEHELVCLFGRRVVAQSKRMRLEDMEIEAEMVAEGARQLREHLDSTVVQRQIVAGMDEVTALALCRWIQNPECLN